MNPDEKECPFCAETIKVKAIICKHCKSDLIVDDASSRVIDYVEKLPNQAKQYGPVTAKQVEQQIKSIGEFDRFFTRKEIKYLPEVMRPGENIKAMTSGFLNGTTWLIVATDQRILFLDKGMFFGLKQVEIPLKAITAIVNKQGILFGGINITAASVSHSITMIDKKDVKRVSEVISAIIHSTQ